MAPAAAARPARSRALGGEALVEHSAVHPGQDHVRHQEVNLTDVGRHHIQARHRGRGDEDAMATPRPLERQRARHRGLADPALPRNNQQTATKQTVEGHEQFTVDSS